MINKNQCYFSSLNRLRELLESPHLDVRLSAGEALAVIFELGRDFASDYEQSWSLDLIEILKELATDSNKYRAKKDRKQQRANFRDILHYIEVCFAMKISRLSIIICYITNYYSTIIIRKMLYQRCTLNLDKKFCI